MRFAFDTITRHMVSADDVAKNNIDEPFRYECLCCGEEVHIAAAQSRRMVPHFRHLRGNSDKDCELYLGGILQTGTGIESAVAVAQKRARSQAEILYDIKQQLFYFSITFSEDKIAEYQEGEYKLEIRTGSDRSMKPVLINKSNFAPDAPVQFPLHLISNSCYISLRSDKQSGRTFTSSYEILKPVDFPTFFKIQQSENDASIAKRHTDGIIYTDTRYYLIASKKDHIKKLSQYSSTVSIGEIEEIPAFRSIVYGAEIVITAVSVDLRDLMQYFGYHLKVAERITMLWPPSYTADGEFRCRPGKVFLSSTCELRPRSNISCDFEQLSRNGELYTIELSKLLRISLSNAILQISSAEIDIPTLNCEPRIETATIVNVDEDNTFYAIGKDGYRLLPPGQYHLTEGTSIIRYAGNYQMVVYVLPEPQKTTPIKSLMDIRKYYRVMTSYSDDLIADIQLSKVAEIYVEDCRNTGMINVKALEYIKAGMI